MKHLATVALVLVLTGCGSDDDAAPQPTSDAPPTAIATATSTDTAPTTSTSAPASTTVPAAPTSPAPTSPPPTTPPSIGPAGNGICDLVTVEEVGQLLQGPPPATIEVAPTGGWRECRYDIGLTGVLNLAAKPIDPAAFEVTRDEFLATRAGVEPGNVEPYPLGDGAVLHTIDADGDTFYVLAFRVGSTFVAVTLVIVGGDPAAVRPAIEQLANLAVGRV